MASLNMRGPYKIWIKDENGNQVKNTGNVVPENIECGNYAFGNLTDGIFYIYYVGRSDSGLLKEINQQIDNGKAKDCELFKFSTVDNAEEAYKKECQNYHDYNPPRNEIHPGKPAGNDDVKCPVEGCEYHE